MPSSYSLYNTFGKLYTYKTLNINTNSTITYSTHLQVLLQFHCLGDFILKKKKKWIYLVSLNRLISLCTGHADTLFLRVNIYLGNKRREDWGRDWPEVSITVHLHHGGALPHCGSLALRRVRILGRSQAA